MKNLLTLLIALVFSTGAFAQSGIEVGVYGSKNHAWLPYNYGFGSWSGGSSFGIRSAYNVTPKIGFQAGLLYTKTDMGMADMGRCGTEPYPMVDIKADFAELQTAFRYRILGEKRVTPYVAVGVSHLFKVRNTTNLASEPDWTINSGTGFGSNYRGALLTAVGARVKISNRLFLDVEPSVKYYVITPTGEKIKDICLGAGLSYKILN